MTARLLNGYSSICVPLNKEQAPAWISFPSEWMSQVQSGSGQGSGSLQGSRRPQIARSGHRVMCESPGPLDAQIGEESVCA